jgi:type I restriction enzyme, R subunit
VALATVSRPGTRSQNDHLRAKIVNSQRRARFAGEFESRQLRALAIDWTERETVRAKLRVMVKRILRKYGYPPDKQEAATKTVLEQAELLCAEWVE